MNKNKKGTHKDLTEACKRASKKYIDKFVEVKVRMFSERRVLIQQHIAMMHE